MNFLCLVARKFSGGALKSLLEQGHSPDAIFDALTSQKVELVLTAHPTEVNRRTMLEKQRRVQKVGCQLHFGLGWSAACIS